MSSVKNLKLSGYTKLLEHIQKWNHSAGSPGPDGLVVTAKSGQNRWFFQLKKQ